MRRVKAFTLIELLVVISIIALLIAILLPALGAARDTARAVTARSDARHIGIALHTYAGDNSDWFPGELPVGVPDNPGKIVTAGTNIYGLADWGDSGAYSGSPTDPGRRYVPQGLGQLVSSPGPEVPEDKVSDEAIFGNYLEVEMLYEPTRFGEFVGHQYFGHEGQVFPDFNSDPWWSSGLYGNYYMTSSWSYRHYNIGDWDGTNDGSGNDQWDQPQGQTNAADMPGKQWANGRTGSPGPFGDAHTRSIVSDIGRWHASVGGGGGNYLLRDGSAHWFANEYHGEGWYTTPSTTSGSPIPNTYTNITTNTHHAIYPSLIHAAIDRHRQGLPTPGSNGVTIDWNS